MANNFIREIVTGGQTGVDRAALDVAIELRIKHSGWCPYGRKAEDGTIPMKYNLKEAPSPTEEECLDPEAIYKKRTELNARDSDGTLIITKDTPMGGTLYTIEMAEKHKKPFLIFNISNNFEINEIVKWIEENKVYKLNVAGPRASQAPGIYENTYTLLKTLLSHPLLKQND